MGNRRHAGESRKKEKGRKNGSLSVSGGGGKRERKGRGEMRKDWGEEGGGNMTKITLQQLVKILENHSQILGDERVCQAKGNCIFLLTSSYSTLLCPLPFFPFSFSFFHYYTTTSPSSSSSQYKCYFFFQMPTPPSFSIDKTVPSIPSSFGYFFFFQSHPAQNRHYKTPSHSISFHIYPSPTPLPASPAAQRHGRGPW